MMRSNAKRPAHLLAALAALCLLPTGSAFAEEQPTVRVQHSRFNFGPRLPNRAWAPVLTRVKNELDHDVEVGVVIGFDVAGRSSERVSFLRRFMLPARSSRTVENYVLLDIPPAALVPLLEKKTEVTRFADGTEVEHLKFMAKPLAVRTRAVNARSGQEYAGSPLLGIPTHPDGLTVIVVDGEPDQYETDETYTLDGIPYVLGEHDKDLTAVGGTGVLYADVFSRANLPGLAEFGKALGLEIIEEG